jgi:hypothetical protein
LACHEGGHVVVGRILFAASEPQARIWDHQGLAWGLGVPLQTESVSLHSNRRIMVRLAVRAMAGEVAALNFGGRVPPNLPATPPAPPQSPGDDDSAEAREEFAEMFAVPPDEEVVWHYCALLGRHPKRRRENANGYFLWLNMVTSRLLWRHVPEILKIARELYTRGTFTYASNGKENRMSIATKLSESLTRKKVAAHARYVEALTKYRAHPEDAALEAAALEAAEAARVDPSQIAADVATLNRAAELAVTVSALPNLKKRFERATGKLKAAEDELARVRDPLEKAIDGAALEVTALEKAVQESQSAIGVLAGLTNGSPELLAGFRNAQVDSFINAESNRVQILRLDHGLKPLRIARNRQAEAVEEAKALIRPWGTSDLEHYPIPPEWMAEERAAVAREEKHLKEIDAEIEVVEKKIASLQ